MRSANQVIAIACGDIHLSHNAPIARAGEPDWYVAMRRPLKELWDLSTSLQVPVLCAGDIFHHWKSPPELINFALDTLPPMYAIPGQHDLPLHNLEDMHKSAYWTLVQAGKIQHITYTRGLHNLMIHGFPWGVPITPPIDDGTNCLHVALIHAYTWIDGSGYTGAPEEAKLTRKNPYRGFRTAIIGDNHKPFDVECGATMVFNCGGFMRRNADEVNHRPRVGLVHADGTVSPHYLDTSKDIITATTEPLAVTPTGLADLGHFLDELKALEGSTLDFPAAIKRAIQRDGTSPAVRKFLLEALEHG